jgi:hypothetical protein
VEVPRTLDAKRENMAANYERMASDGEFGVSSASGRLHSSVIQGKLLLTPTIIISKPYYNKKRHH